MEKNNFWHDAAKYGTYIALVAIAFSVAGMYVTNILLSVASVAVFVWLLYTFVRHRALLYKIPEEGYSYGKCLRYILAVMLFAGVLEGAYGVVAYNWLFAAKYQETVGTMLATLEDTGLYTSDMIEMMMKLYKSPLVWVLGGVLAALFKGLIFGLIVCAFTKQEPDVFAGGNE